MPTRTRGGLGMEHLSNLIEIDWYGRFCGLDKDVGETISHHNPSRELIVISTMQAT